MLAKDQNIVLINPTYRNSKGQIENHTQLGLLYISAFVENKGYSPVLYSGDDAYRFIEEIGKGEEKGSRVIGLYTNSDNIKEVFRIAKYIKTKYQNCFTLLGGPHASSEPKTTLVNENIDFVCVGEGEELTFELLEYLNGNSKLHISQIKNLAYKDSNGVIQINPSRPLDRDLDKFPMPNREHLPRSYSGGAAQLTTGRGCGFKCTFCYESTNSTVRYHSTERVIEEMLFLKEKGVTYFTILDDTFTVNFPRVKKICTKLRDNFKPYVDLFWYCEARVDTIARKPEMIRMMVESGLARVQIGTESGDQKVIDKYKKHITIEQIKSAVKICAESNVPSIFTNFIVGGAIESYDSLEKTEQLIIELFSIAPHRMDIGTNFLSPYPGTDIRENPDSYEIKINDREMIKGPSDEYIFITNNKISRSEIISKRKKLGALINRLTYEQIKTMPRELIKTHLLLKFACLETNWALMLCKDRVLSTWSNFISSDLYNFESDLSASCIPTRTIDPLEILDRVFYWDMRDMLIEFTELEFTLIELASGKNTLEDIVEEIHSMWPEKTRDDLLNDITKYYTSLSKEFLIVFRR